MVSREHRERRRASYEKAAATHRRAQQVELDAAAYFEHHGYPQIAQGHHDAAKRQETLAEADHQRALDMGSEQGR
jgi:hypothetical protein